MQLYLALVT